MEQSQLLAHCGSSKITREELKVIPTPPASPTHQLLPHYEIVGALAETLSFRQISVVREEYAVSGDGMKMFGVLDLETTFDGCRFSVGVRNSNDKSMRLALTVGYRVVVCDNMAFHGDFAPVLAKHTTSVPHPSAGKNQRRFDSPFLQAIPALVDGIRVTVLIRSRFSRYLRRSRWTVWRGWKLWRSSGKSQAGFSIPTGTNFDSHTLPPKVT